MRFTKLTEAHLPGFIYLVDRIMAAEEYDLNSELISDVENKYGKMVVSRSIERAFELRAKLKTGWTGQRPGRTSKKTLDVLVAYYENSDEVSFLDFSLRNSNEIAAHYKSNTPEREWIDKLFGEPKGKVDKKIEKLESKREELIAVMEDYSPEELQQILEPKAKQQFMLLLEEWKSDELKPFFESILERRIEKLEKKITSGKKLQRRLGIFSLLFLPQDDELTFEEDFFAAIEEYEGDVPSDTEVDENLVDLISKMINQ